MSKNLVSIYLLSLGPVFLISSCIKGPGLFQQDESAGTSIAMTGLEDADGIVTGEFNAAAGTTQTLAASSSGDLAGSYVSFPSGSLSINTSITIEQGISFAGATSGDSLGIGNMSAGGPSVVINSSESVDASNPFTLQIPSSSSSSLALSGTDDARTIVLFQYKVAAEGNKEYLGIIPRKKLTIENGYVSFETRHFGAYQVAVTESLVEEAKKVDSKTPILTKAKEKKLSPIEWEVRVDGYKSASRKAEFLVSATGFSGKAICSGFVHEAKNQPPIHHKTADEPKDLSVANKFSYVVTKTAAHKLFVRFECLDANGRIVHSPWSGPLPIPHTDNGGSPEILPNPASLSVSILSRVSLEPHWPVVAGAHKYKLSYKQGPVAPSSCNDPSATHFDVMNPNQTSWRVRGLTPGTSYSFRICTVNQAGIPSAGITTLNHPTNSATEATCDSGDIDTATSCQISSLPGPLLSGPGNVTIAAMINHPTDLTIDIGGTLTIGSGFTLGTQGSDLKIFAHKVIFSGVSAKISASGPISTPQSAGNIEIHAHEIKYTDSNYIEAVGGSPSSGAAGGNGGNIKLIIDLWTAIGAANPQLAIKAGGGMGASGASGYDGGSGGQINFMTGVPSSLVTVCKKIDGGLGGSGSPMGNNGTNGQFNGPPGITNCP